MSLFDQGVLPSKRSCRRLAALTRQITYWVVIIGINRNRLSILPILLDSEYDFNLLGRHTHIAF